MFQGKTIDYWATKELGLVRRKFEMAAAVATLEDEAGAAMLDAEDAGGNDVATSFDRLQRANAERRAIDSAIAACRARRLDAVRVSRQAEISRLRKTAAEKSAELRSLESKTRKLFDQLTALEGCEHVPGGATRSGTLRLEVGQLERSALDLEEADIPVSGEVVVEGANVTEEFLLAVANYPALGPSIEQASDWLAACEEAARKSRHMPFGDNPVRVRLVWNAEGINDQNSWVFCGALAERQPDGVSIYPATGTFRAGVPTTPSGQVAQSYESVSRDGWYRG